MSRRWILSSGSSCILGREPWPGMVGTFHGPAIDRRIMAKTFESKAAALEWRSAKGVSVAFVPEELL